MHTNNDEQWTRSHEAHCEQPFIKYYVFSPMFLVTVNRMTDTRLRKHYLPLQLVSMDVLLNLLFLVQCIFCCKMSTEALTGGRFQVDLTCMYIITDVLNENVN